MVTGAWRCPLDLRALSISRVLVDSVRATTSTPPIQFFGSGKHGIDVQLDDDLDVRPGAKTTLTIDFKLSESFSMRGLSIGHDGLVFKPSVHSHSRHDG